MTDASFSRTLAEGLGRKVQEMSALVAAEAASLDPFDE
jgi:hypothetical protein